MSEANHTPLPWTLRVEELDDDVRSVFIPEIYRSFHDPDFAEASEYQRDLANADFIVRACNAHYDLLEALKCLLNATMFKDHPAESQMAIDAIAKAEGK
jgi:hypothetical protein